MTCRKKQKTQKEQTQTAPSLLLPDGEQEALYLSISQEMQRQSSEPLKTGLYLVATPIGNLGDITLRALSVLSRVHKIYCEDTRHSRILLSHYSITQKLDAYHDHNAEKQRPRILAEIVENKAVALISDAGTPLISDPGFKLVSSAIDQNSAVWVIPGASAVLAGLSLGGLPVDKFLYGGFLPPRATVRQKRISELSQIPTTLIFFETQTRLAESLRDLAEGLGPRDAAVGRELTKFHEEVKRGSLSQLAEHFATSSPRGEFVILIGPPPDNEVSDTAIETSLKVALKEMSLRDAAKKIAEELSVSKARVYTLGIKIMK